MAMLAKATKENKEEEEGCGVVRGQEWEGDFSVNFPIGPFKF